MKTVLSPLVIALILSASSAVLADNTPSGDAKAPFETSVIAFPSTMKLDVVVQNLEGATITVRLVDQLGITQATQYLNKHEKALRTRFDINGLSDGVYRVVVSDGKNTQTKEISLSTHVPTPATFRTISVG